MAWFFTEKNIFGNNYTLVGENAKHISKVLRMRTGDDITLVSPDKTQYECKISLITQGEVTVDIISQKPCENEPETKDLLQVYFISNYNVSYAEKIVVAADLSEQTSTAGLEASGTGNMKFMLNGAPTLGTLDGANVEIAECAGIENEYIFGAKVEDIERMKKEGYHPKALYDANPEIKRVVDTLIDGTFDDGGAQGEGSFKELHDSLLKDSSWQKADNYFLIYDLPDYVDTKIRANTEYANRKEFGKKCLINIANAGKFSSDRTILQYAKEIWHTSYKK
jgi:glycogen phosphorylase